MFHRYPRAVCARRETIRTRIDNAYEAAIPWEDQERRLALNDIGKGHQMHGANFSITSLCCRMPT
jgi:hypothetical protein